MNRKLYRVNLKSHIRREEVKVQQSKIVDQRCKAKSLTLCLMILPFHQIKIKQNKTLNYIFLQLDPVSPPPTLSRILLLHRQVLSLGFQMHFPHVLWALIYPFFVLCIPFPFDFHNQF